MAGFRGSEDGAEELHEINVTPFIDVMLVLLIIFMVAAPLSTVDVPVDLPSTAATPSQPQGEAPVYLTLRRDLTLALGEATIAAARLGPALEARTGGRHDTRIFLRADRSVDYGALMEVMGLLRAAGYLQVALVGLEGPPTAPTVP